MKIIKSSILTLLFLNSFLAYGSVISKSTKCSDIPLDPTLRGGDRPLAQFFEDTTLPAAQRDCWVYEDHTGQNKIIAPFGWGQEPDEFNLNYIKSTFLGMKKSRLFYQSFAQAKDDYFIIISEKRADLAQTYWTTRNQCFIEASYNFIQGNNTYVWQQTIAHELAHCLIMENIPELSPSTYQVSEDAWWDESAAEWLSTLVYPEGEYELQFARAFDVDGKSFMQPYNAFLIFSFQSLKIGVKQMWTIIKNFHMYPNKLEQLRYLKNKELTADFLDFYMAHIEGRVANLPMGFYPVETSINNNPNSPIEIPADINTYSLELKDLEYARANLFEVKIPKGYELRVRPLFAEKDLSLAISENNENWKALDKQITLSSTCESESSFSLMLVHLYSEKLPKVDVEYKLTELEDCSCDLENPRIDKCLVGSWALDFDKVEQLIRNRAQGQPVDINKVTGVETLVFTDGGKSSIDHSWLIAGRSTHTTNSGDTFEMKWSGNSTAIYSTAQQSMLCGQQLSHQSTGVMNYTTQGRTISFPMNSATGPVAPINKGSTTYECAGNQLSITSSEDGEEFTFFYNRM